MRALPKGPFSATVIVMRNPRARFNQAKVRVSFSQSQTQAALLFSAGSTSSIMIIGKHQPLCLFIHSLGFPAHSN